MEIEINNTPATNDDLVEVKCLHPAHRHTIDCRIRAIGSGPPSSSVVLTNPDGRLRFTGPADTTATVSVPGDGSWVGFQISGETASAAIGDAVIQAHCNTSTGALKATKGVTVFSFDQAQINLTQGGAYTISGGSFGVTGGVAVSFSSQARIRPAGVDCAAPQIANLRIAIMQESSAFFIVTTWDTPVVTWLPATAAGTVIAVANSMSETINYDPSVAQPVNDGLAGAFPLYSQRAVSMKPPMGCTGGAAATSSDTPGQGVAAQLTQPVVVAGATVANVSWTRVVSAVRKEHFRTYCAVFDTSSNQHCALSEATWDLNADSSAATPQKATVGASAAASVDPALGVQANNAANASSTARVGAANTNFTKP